MQKDRVGKATDREDHATDLDYAHEALDDLTSALEEVPEAYEVFRHLSYEEQAGLAEWIGKADNPRNRKRRVRMICAVLTRTGSGASPPKDF